jgi:hypothetical protein
LVHAVWIKTAKDQTTLGWIANIEKIHKDLKARLDAMSDKLEVARQNLLEQIVNNNIEFLENELKKQEGN